VSVEETQLVNGIWKLESDDFLWQNHGLNVKSVRCLHGLHDLLPFYLVPCKYLFINTSYFFCLKVNYIIKLDKSNDHNGKDLSFFL
jgi:hypothetical protein